jgi:hypothetical protein
VTSHDESVESYRANALGEFASEAGALRYPGGSLGHVFQNLAELFQTSGRNNHIVAAAIDIFSNPKKPAPGILFQRKNKGLPFDLNFFRFQGVLIHRRFCWPGAVRPVPTLMRRTFI